MSTTAQAQVSIDLRTSPEIKELIVRAASTAGMSVSAFLLGAAQERAKQILAESEMIMLTSRDSPNCADLISMLSFRMHTWEKETTWPT